MASQKKKSESFHFLHMEYEENTIHLEHGHHSPQSALKCSGK